MRTDKWHQDELHEIVYGYNYNNERQLEFSKYEHKIIEPQYDKYIDSVTGEIFNYLIIK